VHLCKMCMTLRCVEFAVRNMSAVQVANSCAKIFLFTAFPFVLVKAILVFLLIPSHLP